jgi:RNA polymerase sigma-70 factor (ECF subfamily)
MKADANTDDSSRSPEEECLDREREDSMRRVLAALSERDREALTRFYLQKQSAETICAEMGLPTTQFRLLKSRAKARFAKLDKTRLVQKTLRESVQ